MAKRRGRRSWWRKPPGGDRPNKGDLRFEPLSSGAVYRLLPQLMEDVAIQAEELQRFLSPTAEPDPLRQRVLGLATLLRQSAAAIRPGNPAVRPADALIGVGGILALLLQQARALCLEEHDLLPGMAAGLTMPAQPSRLTYLFAQAVIRLVRTFCLVRMQTEVVLSGDSTILAREPDVPMFRLAALKMRAAVIWREDLTTLAQEPDSPAFRRAAHGLFLGLAEVSGKTFPYDLEQQAIVALLLATAE